MIDKVILTLIWVVTCIVTIVYFIKEKLIKDEDALYSFILSVTVALVTFGSLWIIIYLPYLLWWKEFI